MRSAVMVAIGGVAIDIEAAATLPGACRPGAGPPRRARPSNYSELHEALREGTPAADSVRRILRAGASATSGPRRPRRSTGTGSWNDALLAATRIRGTADPRSADSAPRHPPVSRDRRAVPVRTEPRSHVGGPEPSPPGDPARRRRAKAGDRRPGQHPRPHSLPAVQPRRRLGVGGLRAGAVDSVRNRFLDATTAENGRQSTVHGLQHRLANARHGLPHTAPGTPHTAPGTPHTAPGTPHTAQGTPHTAPSTPHTARGTPHSGPGTPTRPAAPTHAARGTTHRTGNGERGTRHEVVLSCPPCRTAGFGS